VNARWGELARHPLARFLALGALIFAADRALVSGDRADDGRRIIVVSDRFVEGLRARHRERTGREPTPEEEAALIRDFAREEALEREARAAALDVGDAIVRRRLVQKLEFVLAGTTPAPEPTDDDLRAWIDAHADTLAIPGRTTLEHVFFSHQERGERARDDARAMLATGVAGVEGGDPFLGGHRLGPADDRRIDAALGPGTAAAIAALPVGAWQGPVEGALGTHLVRVIAREPARAPELDAVRARVRAEWVEERRREEVEREIARIVAQYPIVRVREDAP
jgi:hypothetical protein